MKKVFLLCLTFVVMAACTQTPEDKAKDMIKEGVKRMLYKPESYDAVSTSIDSVFTPYGAPAFYEQTLKVYKLAEEIRSLKNGAKEKKSSMALHSGPYQTAYGRNAYNEAKEEYDEIMAKQEKLEKKVHKMVDGMKAQIKAERQFVGFWAYHRYRAKNNAGETSFGEVVFLFNKDLSQIVYAYDPDDGDFKKAMLLFKLMQGRDIELEEDAWRVDTDLWEEIWEE